MSRPVTLALLDGPLGRDHPGLAQSIDLAHEDLADGEAARRAAAHARTIAAHAPAVRLVNLVVPGRACAADAPVLAEALHDALGVGADIVHCAVGLSRREPAIAEAVEALAAAGAFVVAAAAGTGPVYPANLPGVLSVGADGRCGPDEWSVLDLPTAFFGACPRLASEPAGDAGALEGAGVAAAHLSGHLARLLAQDRVSAVERLRRGAAHVGRPRGS